MSKEIKFLIIGVLIGALLVFSASLFKNDTPLVVEQAKVIERINNGKIAGYAVPKKISFAGEEVPLVRADVAEKLEREIQVNAFWHSNSVILLKRANKWLPTIDSILIANGIPADFKYVAVAESGLENVVSPAKAVGFWQFLKGTAQDFGLIVNGEVDQRYDPVLATVAATKYLKQAYDKFGNWTTVAASYNLGMGGTARIVKNQKAETYFDMILTEEPTRYVFRIIALKNMLENPTQFGFDVPDDKKYFLPKTSTFVVTKSLLDLHAFAAEKNISYFELRNLNPWIRNYRLSLKKGQTFEIKLPIN